MSSGTTVQTSRFHLVALIVSLRSQTCCGIPYSPEHYVVAYQRTCRQSALITGSLASSVDSCHFYCASKDQCAYYAFWQSGYSDTNCMLFHDVCGPYESLGHGAVVSLYFRNVPGRDQLPPYAFSECADWNNVTYSNAFECCDPGYGMITSPARCRDGFNSLGIPLPPFEGDPGYNGYRGCFLEPRYIICQLWLEEEYSAVASYSVHDVFWHISNDEPFLSCEEVCGRAFGSWCVQDALDHGIFHGYWPSKFQFAGEHECAVSVGSAVSRSGEPYVDWTSGDAECVVPSKPATSACWDITTAVGHRRLCPCFSLPDFGDSGSGSGDDGLSDYYTGLLEEEEFSVHCLAVTFSNLDFDGLVEDLAVRLVLQDYIKAAVMSAHWSINRQDLRLELMKTLSYVTVFVAIVPWDSTTVIPLHEGAHLVHEEMVLALTQIEGIDKVSSGEILVSVEPLVGLLCHSHSECGPEWSCRADYQCRDCQECDVSSSIDGTCDHCFLYDNYADVVDGLLWSIVSMLGSLLLICVWWKRGCMCQVCYLMKAQTAKAQALVGQAVRGPPPSAGVPPVQPTAMGQGLVMGRVVAYSSANVTVIDDEHRNANLKKTMVSTVPSHWENRALGRDSFDDMFYVRPEHHAAFDDLLASTYEPKVTRDRPCPTGAHPEPVRGGCPCVRPGADPGLPTGFRVRRVVRVEDSNMWARYVQKKQQIRSSRPVDGDGNRFRLIDTCSTVAVAQRHPEVFDAKTDTSLNEVLLMHGSFVRNALKIAQDDFRLDLAGSSTGTMFGNGIYFSESSTKADEYAMDEPGNWYENVYTLLVCRCCLGKTYYITKADATAGDRVRSGEFDSVVGDRRKAANTFREFVQFDPDQVYPEYIVLYTRVHSADDPDEVERLASVPFHCQLPVYWTACALDPAKTAFHAQYLVSFEAQKSLMRLVRSTVRERRVEIIDARRVENSAIWNRYTDFKLAVKNRLKASSGPKTLAEHSVLRFSRLAEARSTDQVLTMTVSERNESVTSASNLERNLNEVLLWHGTSMRATELIAQNDFRVPEGAEVSHGKRFGKGAYFAESLSKSLLYAESVNGVCYVLLCRVCCGEVYYTEARNEEDADMTARDAGKDCVLANPDGTGPREFVTLSVDQVYPEYILQLRLGGKSTE